MKIEWAQSKWSPERRVKRRPMEYAEPLKPRGTLWTGQKLTDGVFVILLVALVILLVVCEFLPFLRQTPVSHDVMVKGCVVRPNGEVTVPTPKIDEAWK